MAASLTISDFSTGYPGHPVIENLSLAPIKAGRVTALVGPNAAGKSTLLRALAGLLAAEGSVCLDDQNLFNLSLNARAGRVTYMPQTLPEGVALSVLESVISALKASPLDGLSGDLKSVRRRALQTLDRIGIADLALEPLDRLSGGQRQLASLAQAVVRSPDVLLLDEPTSALDLRHQVNVMRLVHSFAASGKIVIVVLHDLNLAARWADRVVVLDEGAVYAEGAPDQAITPDVLAKVYGVEARVERCTRGCLQVMVDGPRQQPRPARMPSGHVNGHFVS